MDGRAGVGPISALGVGRSTWPLRAEVHYAAGLRMNYHQLVVTCAWSGGKAEFETIARGSLHPDRSYKLLVTSARVNGTGGRSPAFPRFKTSNMHMMHCPLRILRCRRGASHRDLASISTACEKSGSRQQQHET